jgi:hypothetical protein
MKKKRNIYLAFIGIILILPISTLAFFGPYGKLRVQPRGAEKVTIEMLEEGWQDYHVYFAGPWIGRPSAIMFDPKGDDKKLVPHKWWVPVKNEEDLLEVVWGIKVGQVDFWPIVWRIMGPDDQFYGYMYTAWHHVLIKVVDNKTLWVDDIPLPRFDLASGDRPDE